jgi:hypothetical protein
MSYNALLCAYGEDAAYVPDAGGPASAYVPAMMGADALVPPTTSQPPVWYVS